jgi:hypothetical protein
MRSSPDFWLGADDMNALIQRVSLSVILVLLIASCTGVENQGTVEVLRNLRTSNLDSSQFPWTRSIADGRTKRWDIERDGLIPVKVNGSALAQEAITEIETILQMSLFDTTLVANLPDDMIVRGIIVSEGTAIGPGGAVTRNTCGHVSALPETTEYPENFYNSEGRINTRLYVSLSSKKCTASLEIAIHEFGHALGLGKHFTGFGSGKAIAPSFWQVLYTLYHNDVGISAEELNIELHGQ